MGLSKFPVTSKNGNVYKVDVGLDEDFDQFVVEVFIERKGFLGLFKWKSVSGGSWHGRYNIDKWGYDLITMAVHQVEKYEKGIRELQIHNREIEEACNKFVEWDGNIK